MIEPGLAIQVDLDTQEVLLVGGGVTIRLDDEGARQLADAISKARLALGRNIDSEKGT